MRKYLFVLTIVAVLALPRRTWRAANTGREWMAIRDMDVAAEVIGIRPMTPSCSRSRSARSTAASPARSTPSATSAPSEPEAFSLDDVVPRAVHDHRRRHGHDHGAFFGAAFFTVLPIFLSIVVPGLAALVHVNFDKASLTYIEFMIFGALIVFFLIVEPHGIARLWQIGKEKLRIWPFPH